MKLLLSIVLCSGLLGAPAGDDCHASGPHIQVSGSDAPTIIDNGGMTTNGGQGCDGCTVDYDIMIVWNHSGTGVVTLPDGSVIFGPVSPGEFQDISGTDKMACGGTSRIDVVTDNGGGFVEYRCSFCQ